MGSRPAGWFAVAALLSLASCGGGEGPRLPSQRPEPGLGATSGLAELRSACVPTGPERCFDARDDNCNGLIDEGCGVRSGVVQFTIAWDAPSADVDLLVTDPKGDLVEVGRPSATGLVKERDCPGRRKECKGRNLENVFLESDEAKRGVYRVKIRLERLQGDDVPIRVAFAARVGPRTYEGEVELLRTEEEKRFSFEL